MGTMFSGGSIVILPIQTAERKTETMTALGSVVIQTVVLLTGLVVVQGGKLDRM